MNILAAFQNLDLFAVGIATAAIGIFTIAVFLNNPKSSTSRAFLLLGILTILYGIVNYLNDQFTSPTLILLFLRLTLFFSVLHAFSFFRLFYVFPQEKAKFPRSWGIPLLIGVACISLLTLTPLVFSHLDTIAPVGQVTNPVRGPAIAVFGIAVVFLILSGIFFLLKKLRHATGIERRQFQFVVTGAAITFLSLIFFNYIIPIFFNQLSLIPLAPVYFFPFIALTAYAIVRHHLLDIKVISTEILAFVLTTVTFSEIIFSQSFAEVLFRVGELILVLIFSLLLIKSVLREVEQREELERLNKQIEEKNSQLEDLSRFKSQLLSLASHQIKSPLAAIKGFVSLILDGSYGETGDKVKETLKKVQNSADDLIGLINTLLDVRKVEEGKMEYKFERTDLNKMVVDMTELLKPLADAKKLEFTFISPGHEVWVNADPEKLKQVIQNLTDNAIKYTPSGFVKVELKEDITAVASVASAPPSIGTAVVSVTDSGLGVAPELIPHLFEEFVRDERVKKQIRGTGLGLYIARKIAEAHGGKISAESEGEGKGSKFSLSLLEIK